MNQDDLIFTPSSPDNDEALRQFGKSIKILKSFQPNNSRKESSHSQNFFESVFLQKEDKLVEQVTVQLVTDETAIDDESVTTNSLNNSFKFRPFDKQNSFTCSLNKKENNNINININNNNTRNMYQKRQKGQSKNTFKEKKPNITIIDRKNSDDSIENDNNNNNNNSSESVDSTISNNNAIPFDISQNKRLRKKNSENTLLDDGTIVTGYAITHPKRNRDFHNFFKNIPYNEYLINDYTCALQREILLQGRIFVSIRHICFHSNIFSKVTNIVIPFSDITAIEKKSTAFVIPNAILISVGNTKYSFTSFLSRDSVYELLMKLWEYSNSNASENRTIDDVNEIIEEGHKESKSEMSESSDTQYSANLREEDGKTTPTTYSQEDSDVSSTYLKDYSPTYSREEDNNKIQIHNGNTCDCLKVNRHFNNVIWDTTFKGSVEKIYNLLYASEFISEFLNETGQKDGSTKCNFEVLHQDFKKYVTIMKYTETPNVPSGRGFKAKTRTCIMQAVPDTTRVIVTCAVESLSNTTVNKFANEKSYLEGQLAYYKKLETAVRNYISQNLTEFDRDLSPSIAITEDEEDVEDVDQIHSSRKQYFMKKRKKYLNEDTISNKLRMSTISTTTISMPTMSTIILITIILTLISNICYLAYLGKINANISANIEAKFTERFPECIGERSPLNEWINGLRRRQLSSILDDVNR